MHDARGRDENTYVVDYLDLHGSYDVTCCWLPPTLLISAAADLLCFPLARLEAALSLSTYLSVRMSSSVPRRAELGCICTSRMCIYCRIYTWQEGRKTGKFSPGEVRIAVPIPENAGR